jgi:ACS family hexuronate transporter-like MFS transporter
MKAAASSPGPSPNWTDPCTWAFIATYALGAFPTGFVLYETSLYLSAALHKSQLQIGEVLWIPPLGWEVGYFFWGWATDRFADAGASIPALRRQYLLLTWLSLPLAFVPRVQSFPLVMAMLFFAMFVTSGFIIGAIAYATRRFSDNHAGLIAGLGAGSWSAVLALVMPGIGRLFDFQWYSTAFTIASLFPIVGYFAWKELDRHSPFRPGMVSAVVVPNALKSRV